MKKPSCENCEHYIRHYRKGKTRYEPVSCGHCTNRKPSGHFRKTDKICEFYAERDSEQEKKGQIKSATEYLAFIDERLYELKEIIKE